MEKLTTLSEPLALHYLNHETLRYYEMPEKRYKIVCEIQAICLHTHLVGLKARTLREAELKGILAAAENCFCPPECVSVKSVEELD